MAMARRAAGWLVVAARSSPTTSSSLRFLVLLIVLGLGGGRSRCTSPRTDPRAAARRAGAPAVFLALFMLGPPISRSCRVYAFVGIVAPLLGVAFAFDAVNGERSEGTLPRLLSQPIYRDDVINGKFAAGLAIIAWSWSSVVLFISGFGIAPPRHRAGRRRRSAADRLAAPDGPLCRAVAGLRPAPLGRIRGRRRCAGRGSASGSSLPVFGELIVDARGPGIFAPYATPAPPSSRSRSQNQRPSPGSSCRTLYQEAHGVILHPNLTQISTPATLGQLEQTSSRSRRSCLSTRACCWSGRTWSRSWR